MALYNLLSQEHMASTTSQQTETSHKSTPATGKELHEPVLPCPRLSITLQPLHGCTTLLPLISSPYFNTILFSLLCNEDNLFGLLQRKSVL